MRIDYSRCWAVFLSSGLVSAKSRRRAASLTQYTPTIKDWSTLNDKSVLQNSKNADHNIDSVHWIDASQWLPWNGVPYNASQYSRSELADLICPGNTIRGLREVFNRTDPFSPDPVRPSKAQVDAWHGIAINHVRALVGYTEAEYQIEPDQCLHVRALWTEERKNTDIWDERYPEGTCVGSSPHCGASFIPVQEDQAPYLPEGVESCGARAGSEGLFNAAKSNIPWSIRFIRPLCATLRAEGFWGGHTGPWFHRKEFGFSWRDMDTANTNSNAGLVAKWAGDLAPNKYVDPRITNGDFLLQVEGEDPNPRFSGYQCKGAMWMLGGSPNATNCFNRVMANDDMGKKFFTWKSDGGCAGYPVTMVECEVVRSASRLTWDLDSRSFSFDGLMFDPEDALWTNRECRNIRWKTSAGDAMQCLQKLVSGPPGPFPDCGRNFLTWNAANGGCACYAPEQECTDRGDTVNRSGRRTYALLPDPAYDSPSPNPPAPTGLPSSSPSGDPSDVPTAPPSVLPSISPSGSPASDPISPSPSSAPSDSPPADEPKYYVVCGKGTGCHEGNEDVAVASDLHEVRCCKDEHAFGFETNRCENVWAASDLGGCHFQKTYAQAEEICVDYDSRLCTRAEISDGCTRGSGCSIDGQLVWSSTLVASGPVTPSPSSAPSDSPPADEPKYYVVCGKGTGCRKGNEDVAVASDLHEVRCCKDEHAFGFKTNRCENVWAASDLGGCHFQKTYAQAEEICVDYDSRLCTRTEISDECTRGSGCSMDGRLVWSSTLVASGPVTPSPSSAPSDSFSSSPSNAPAPSNMSCSKLVCCLDCFCCGPGTSWSPNSGRCMRDPASITGDDDGSCGRMDANVVTTSITTTATDTTITTGSSITIANPACSGMGCCGDGTVSGRDPEFAETANRCLCFGV